MQPTTWQIMELDPNEDEVSVFIAEHELPEGVTGPLSTALVVFSKDQARAFADAITNRIEGATGECRLTV